MRISRLSTTRKKAFSHKVRTGCITCKRGDRQCLGYAIPAAKIFTLENRGVSSSKRGLPSRIPQTATCDDELLLSKTVDASFGTNEELRSLQHWLLLTSPVLAHYGPQGDFYTVLVPQLAQQSPAVKHMLVALSMTHEKFHTGVVAATPTMTSQAVSHYIAAIAEIRNKNPPKLHVVIASLVAWVIELFQNNLPAAVVHLRGTLKLLREYKRSKPSRAAQEVLRSSILPTSSLAKGLTQLMILTGPTSGEIEPEYQGHICHPWGGSAFSSFVEGRTTICRYIEQIADTEHACDVREMERLLGNWFERARRWDQEAIPTSARTALLLLFNLALALLPASDVAGFSYVINPSTIDFVVDKATELANIYQKVERSNQDLKQTLIIVLGFVERLFPDSRSHGQALLLLNQLRGQG
ncbi:hypothetical protein AYO20_08092 [Fonsecaea nubica]|uniref:Zn(2)-C6 fungal-type domain-containing protein n=1 Tax=Fonsecaea nubica TaxID=856822 RepID=A0A178CPD7_9EURO|nr:hypothetical protein AYO20_08092 [Fonsecaea nubica]OAL31699.1 hypothetical protein AYO20_08092 [Fonsecaea nubica]